MLLFRPNGCVTTPDIKHPKGTQIKFIEPIMDEVERTKINYSNNKLINKIRGKADKCKL